MNTPIKKARGRPRDDAIARRRREEILDTAVRVFARHGYRKTDLQVVADTLGVGKGTVYRYFPSKQALFLGAVDRGLRRMKEAVDAAVSAAADSLDSIQLAMRAYLEFFDTHPEICELLIQERAEFRDRKPPTYFEHREINVVAWQDRYRDLIAAGRVRPIAPERITDVIGPLLYGTMITNYFSGRRRTPAEQAADIIDIVFQGILSDCERSRRA